MAMDFGQQIGPLPLGGWVAVVGGGLGIAWYTSRHKTAAPTVVTDTSGDPGVGLGPSWTAVPPPSSAPDNSTPITTNDEWAIAAINWLIAQGYDPGMSDTAVRKYLESTQLTPQEWMLLRMALGKLGSPPIPLPDPPPPPAGQPPVVPPQAPPTVPAQPAPVISMSGRYVWVQPWPSKQSTLWGIAQVYYGDGNKWRDIFSHNYNGQVRPDGTIGQIKDPNKIYAGWKLWVP